MSAPEVGKVGIWSMELRFRDNDKGNALAAELDEMGYGTLWIPGLIDGGVLGVVDRLLSVTNNITIATGILNLWKHEPKDVADWFEALPDSQKSRVMLGIGISHGPLIGENWGKPMAKTREFLDGLKAAGMEMDNTCLAALGPKMLALSGERTAGAHPYLVTPEHTAQAREILGPGKLLMPEQGVVFGDDPAKIREIAEAGLSNYLALPNYRNNWLRLGLTEEDIETVSDRLIDSMFATGSASDMAGRVQAHHDAGADHVCIQIVSGAKIGDIDALRPHYRSLADAML